MRTTIAILILLACACGDETSPERPPRPNLCGYCDRGVWTACDEARLVGSERTGYDWGCWIRTRLNEGHIRGSCVDSCGE